MKKAIKINFVRHGGLLQEGPPKKKPRPGSAAAEFAAALSDELTKRDKKTLPQRVKRVLWTLLWGGLYTGGEWAAEKFIPGEYERWIKYTDIRRPTIWVLRRYGISHYPPFNHITGDDVPTDMARSHPWADDPVAMEELQKAGSRVVEIMDALEGTTDDDDPKRRDKLTGEFITSIEKGDAVLRKLEKQYGKEPTDVSCLKRPEGLPDGYAYGIKNPYFATMEPPTSVAGKNLREKYDKLWAEMERALNAGKVPHPNTCQLLSYFIWGPWPGGK